VASLAIAAAGIALVGMTILRHELWRDELQAWQIARASDGFHALVHNTRYEGHPILWYGLLSPLAHAHPGPGAMQLLQFFIATTTISVAAFRAPFTLLQKAMFVFGYFVLYEYGVLTSSYGLGAMLLVVTLAIAATRERRRWPVIGALLGVIALTSAFGALVAIAVLLGLGVDEHMRKRNETGSAAGSRAVLLGAALTLNGLAVAYIQAGRNPRDTGSYGHWRTNLDIGLGASSFSSVWRALVPIPSLERTYWNTNIVSARAAVVGLLGLLLFVGVAWLLRDRPGSFVVWVGGVALVVGFLYARIGTATASRHIGHVFLCLVAAMWLAPGMQEWGHAVTRSRARSARHGTSTRFPGFPLTRSIRVDAARARSGAWTLLLVIQLIAGLFAAGLDLTYPFSNGREVADYIRNERLDGLTIIGLPDTAASTVAGYLDRPIYYLAGGRSGTYVLWNTARNQLQPLDTVIRTQPGLSNALPVLLLVNRPLDDPNLPVRLLAHFDNGIVRDEHFWLYVATAQTGR
jgi:hypothetical protein